MILEVQAGVRVDSDSDQTEDGAYVMNSIESFWSQLYCVEWRIQTKNWHNILDYLKLSKLSVDKVTQFGIIQPELLKIFNRIVDYYRWFVI